jgi:hypothetical protein
MPNQAPPLPSADCRSQLSNSVERPCSESSVWRWTWPITLLRSPSGVIATKVGKIPGSSRFNFGVGPRFRPLNPIVPYPIVRPARLLPVPNRWAQRHGVAIERNVPPRRLNWRHNLVATTASTQVRSRPIGNGNVQLPVFQDVWDVLHKFVLNRLSFHVPRFPLTS